MNRFVTLLSRGLLAIIAAILISVSMSQDAAAAPQDAAAAPQDDAARDLQTIVFQDTELWQQHVNINGESIPILYAMPCLRGNAESIAGDFRERTGLDLSGFAAMTQGNESGRNEDVWLGVYEDYSFLSTVRIATAPLRDPNLLPALGTAYAFPLADIPSRGRRHLAGQVLVGAVGVAEHRDGSYEFILPSNENWPRVVNQMYQPVSADGGAISATHLVARDTEIFEPVRETAPRRVIAWNTDQPLRAVLLESYREVLLESMRAAVCTDDEVIKPENGDDIIPEERR